MVAYRRARVPGACYFLTLALRDRREALLVRHIDALRASVQEMQRRYPCRLPAAVVLPEHLHLLMQLPPGDADFSTRVRVFKQTFVRLLRERGEVVRCNHRNEADVWQARFWEHLIRDERDYAAHVDYIHCNPRKHGLVERVCDWPYSSFHRYVADGRLPWAWAGGGSELSATGE